MKNLIKDNWPAMLIILMGLILVLSGCTTLQKATGYFNDHPEKAAPYCAEKFPVIDSIGTPEIIYGQGKNEDYQPLVDSLYNGALIISDTGIWRGGGNVIGLWNTQPVQPNVAPCPELDRYKTIARRLTDQIFRLNARYKPCVPDTVIIKMPVYRTSTALVYKWMGMYAGQRARNDQLEADKTKWKALAVKCMWIISILVAYTALKLYLRTKGIKLPL